MEYRVIIVSKSDAGISTMSLEKKVNDLINQGWKPQGGVSVSRTDLGSSCMVVMAQAMIKE